MDFEEVIFEGFDESWGKILPVTVICYSTGGMDIHRQSGSQFDEHIKEAEKILAQRNLKLDPNDRWAAGPTGIYRRIISV